MNFNNSVNSSLSSYQVGDVSIHQETLTKSISSDYKNLEKQDPSCTTQEALNNMINGLKEKGVDPDHISLTTQDLDKSSLKKEEGVYSISCTYTITARDKEGNPIKDDKGKDVTLSLTRTIYTNVKANEANQSKALSVMGMYKATVQALAMEGLAQAPIRLKTDQTIAKLYENLKSTHTFHINTSNNSKEAHSILAHNIKMTLDVQDQELANKITGAVQTPLNSISHSSTKLLTPEQQISKTAIKQLQTPQQETSPDAIKQDNSLNNKVSYYKGKPVPPLPPDPKKVENAEVTPLPHTKMQSKGVEIDVNKSKHLFLQESHSYISTFFDKLIAKVNPEQKERIEELKQLKEKTLDQLLNQIYKGTGWLDKDNKAVLIDKAVAEKEWSSSAEALRQKKASQMLTQAMYDAVYIADEAGVKGVKPNKQGEIGPNEIHATVCFETSKEKEKNVQDKETKRIDIQFQFTLQLPEGGNLPKELKVNIHTAQFGDQITTSMEKRVRKGPENKLYGVNLHQETVKFQTSNGQTIVSKQVRSGSFDMNDVQDPPADLKDLSEDAVKQLLNGLKSGGESFSKNVQAYIDSARKGDDPQALHQAIQVFKKYADDLPPGKEKTEGMTELGKYQKELERMRKDNVIINANAECVRGVFEQTKNLDKGQKLGMQLPNEVMDVLKDVPDLQIDKQSWGMISLQTPVNVLGGKGINRWILKQAQNPNIPGFMRSVLEKISQKDISELDPIYRELKGFKKASNETDFVARGLYFNLPTNVFGAKMTLFNLGPLTLKTRISNFFNAGLVDRTRRETIAKETGDSTKTVYDLATKAQAAVGKKIQDLEKKLEGGSPEEKRATEKSLQTLRRYKNSLDCLIDQTFTNTDSGVKLQDAPSKHAQYEVLGRLTVLMQMLNFNTNGHCRSGNNRTAAWLAKSHQIIAAMAASPDGRIPSPKTMAGTLAVTMRDKLSRNLPAQFGQKIKDHWSLQVFLNVFQTSLTLQQANKGTQGTKLNVVEISNKALRTALFKGAFDLAGRYEGDLMAEARERRIEKHLESMTDKINSGKLSADDIAQTVGMFKKLAEGDLKAKSYCIKGLKAFKKQIQKANLKVSSQEIDDALKEINGEKSRDITKTATKVIQSIEHPKPEAKQEPKGGAPPKNNEQGVQPKNNNSVPPSKNENNQIPSRVIDLRGRKPIGQSTLQGKTPQVNGNWKSNVVYRK